MISLAEYYQPLNLQLIIFSLLTFLFFDVLGFVFNLRFIKSPDFLRPVNWLYGIGIFVFIWFLLYFFIPLNSTFIIISACVLVLVSFPSYLRNDGLPSLLSCFKANPWPLIIILPLLPAVFVKASLPPYYFDEMAYQFLSPISIIKQNTWDFWPGGFYQNLPRTLNLFFWLIFSVVKSYSPARFLHFVIYATSMFSIYLWIKKNFNFFAAIIFFTLFLYLPQDVLTSSTLGYVDIASIFMASLGVISLVDYLLYRKPSSFLSSSVLWGLALGIKNTPLTSLISYLVVFVIFLSIDQFRHSKKSKPSFKLIAISTILFSLFGGFWYIKNLILFYNPIYPFVFPCRSGLAEVCGKGSAFFNGWMQPITLKTFPSIFSGLMANLRPLGYLFGINLLLLFHQRNKNVFKTTIFILLSVLLEFFLLKNFSGYYARYHQHIQISLFILFVLQVIKPLPDKHNKNLIFVSFSLILLFLSFRNAFRLLKFTYSGGYLPTNEVNYALGKEDIRNWISLKFPKMKDFIFFCETPPNNQVFKYAWIDPDLVWFEYDGMMRTFMTNCEVFNPPIIGVPITGVETFVLKNKSDFYFPSVHTCVSQEEVKKPNNIYANSNQLYLNELTNKLVCLSQTTEVPYLYHLTWRNLKTVKR